MLKVWGFFSSKLQIFNFPLSTVTKGSLYLWRAMMAAKLKASSKFPSLLRRDNSHWISQAYFPVNMHKLSQSKALKKYKSIQAYLEPLILLSKTFEISVERSFSEDSRNPCLVSLISLKFIKNLIFPSLGLAFEGSIIFEDILANTLVLPKLTSTPSFFLLNTSLIFLISNICLPSFLIPTVIDSLINSLFAFEIGCVIKDFLTFCCNY